MSEARRLAQQARAQLGRSARQTLESSLVHGAIRDQLSKADSRMAAEESLEGLGGEPAAVAVASADVTDAAARAMDKVDAGNESNLTEFEFVALEAIVQLTGRPAMRYSDNRVTMPPNDLGDNDRWRTFVAIARSKINATSASVGQVAIDNGGSTRPLGTAWRLGTDLVVTNRHVAAALVADASLPKPQWALSGQRSIVDFNATDSPAAQPRFPITGLLFTAEETDVDFAVLRIDGGGQALPAALKLDFEVDSIGRTIDSGGTTQFQGEEIYIVGHPFRQFASSQSAQVFGNADATKRCSPGVVTSLGIATRPRGFEHDCSTLGGNSGSCVLSVSGHRVVGLHYGGANVDEDTGMGRANLALGLSRLGDHRVMTILREGRVA